LNGYDSVSFVCAHQEHTRSFDTEKVATLYSLF
jgi:hypothetical protein